MGKDPSTILWVCSFSTRGTESETTSLLGTQTQPADLSRIGENNK